MAKSRSTIPSTISEPVPDLRPSEPLDVFEPEPPGPTLDTACQVLLNYVPAYVSELIRELAHASGRPLAAYILGYIDRAYGQKALNSPLRDPGYAGDRALTETAVPQSTDCAWCHAPLVAPAPHQRYCPSTDDKEPCAVSAALEPLRAARRARRTPAHAEAPPVRQR